MAIKCYDLAIQIDPKNTLAINNKGSAYYNLKDYDKAKQCFDEAFNIDPDDPDVIVNK